MQSEPAPEDQPPARTLEWLGQLFRQEVLSNTTILIAGRRHGDWMKLIGERANQVKEVSVAPFTPDVTQRYFKDLLDEWTKEPGEVDAYFKRRLSALTDLERATVLTLYTGGQPVKLALFTDILIDGHEEPSVLKASLDNARKDLEWDGSEVDRRILEERQYVIEEEFITTLFDKVGDPRAQILMTLPRTRYPMDAEQLEYVLYGLPVEMPADFPSKEERRTIILDTLQDMRHLSFVKTVDGIHYFLQDEIYALFDKHHSDNQPKRLDIERRERSSLYARMVNYLDWQIEQVEQQLQGFWLVDRRRLLMEGGDSAVRFGEMSPLQADQVRFTDLDIEEVEKRAQAREMLEALQLERLHYRFRLDPYVALYDDYYEIADAAWLEIDEDFMAHAQAQLWRFLNDKIGHQFTMLDAVDFKQLPYLAEFDHAIRRVKQLCLRSEYAKAASLAEQFQQADFQRKLTSDRKEIWQHPICTNELVVFGNYARSYLGGGETHQAACELAKAGAALEAIAPDGFKPLGGAYEPEDIDNPVQRHIHRILGATYFSLGYAEVSQGKFSKALESYQKSLRYLRRSRFEIMQVFCSFNLARVIAECGHSNRAIRICYDALEMLHDNGRGGTHPFGLAENTLALIYNRMQRPDRSWREAAIAHACFLRSGHRRGIVLAKLQLGEALRRMADQYDSFRFWPALALDVLRLYDLSEKLLRSAENMLSNDTKTGQETVRVVEAKIELGCALRDRSQPHVEECLEKMAHKEQSVDSERLARRLLSEADSLFGAAKEHAEQIGHNVLLLDAMWEQANVAYWLYRLAPESKKQAQRDKSRGLLEQVTQTAREKRALGESSELSQQNASPERGSTEAPILRRLARIYQLLGRIDLEEFEEQAKIIRQRQPSSGGYRFEKERKATQQAIVDDPAITRFIDQAAEHYTISLGYVRMHAPCSAVRALVYDELFAAIRSYSDIVMDAFVRAAAQKRMELHIAAIQAEPLEDLPMWLQESFGYPPP